MQPFFGLKSDLKHVSSAPHPQISCGAYHSVAVLGEQADLFEQAERFGNVRRVELLNFWAVDSAPDWTNATDLSFEIQK